MHNSTVAMGMVMKVTGLRHAGKECYFEFFHRRSKSETDTIQRCSAPTAARSDHGLQTAVAHATHPRIAAHCCGREETCGSLPSAARYIPFFFVSSRSLKSDVIMTTSLWKGRGMWKPTPSCQVHAFPFFFSLFNVT